MRHALPAGIALFLAVFFVSGFVAVCVPGRALAQGDDLTTVKAEGSSQAETAVAAAREISEKTTAQVAREQAIEVIGEKKYAKLKSIVEAKVVREAAKFIPYVSPSEPERGPDGVWHMSVEMRVSRASLRGLIAKAGLLVENDGPASVLPMVSIVDRVRGVTYSWWTGEPDASRKYLAQLGRQFHEALYAEFAKIGFFGVRPHGPTAALVPEALRLERPTTDDLAAIGTYFRASLVVQGEVRLRESREAAGAYQASLRLAAMQAANGRSVGEVARDFDTETGSFEAVVRQKLTAAFPEVSRDLAAQVLDVWQKGALGTGLVQLALKGKLGPKQLDGFKVALLRAVREVKSARERLFEPGQVTLELESAATPLQLSDRLKSIQIPGFQTRVVGQTEKAVSLEIVARP
jgi:hypothetical protein